MEDSEGLSMIWSVLLLQKSVEQHGVYLWAQKGLRQTVV